MQNTSIPQGNAPQSAPSSPDAAIIYSGGLDSTTLLYEYKSRIALAISFHYGSNHNDREIECARYHCARLGIEHLVIPLAFIKEHIASALTSGPDAIPDGNYDAQGMHATVVPFRNGIMLAVACGIAESRGLSHILIANHGGDHHIYPDCRPQFVEAMDSAMRAGTYAGISLLAPYTHIDKAEIVRRGAALGIDYAHTYSCYRGTAHHCGTCGTCIERRQAFALAGLDDPTSYDD